MINALQTNRTTNTTYTLDNQIATLTAVNSTTGDQTTTYTYGTTLTSSGVARNDLLASVTYPDSVSGSDVVSYAYNRLGQVRTTTDQRGTIRTFYYDKLGRQTNDCVTTNGTGTDVAVKQIASAYEVRGMVQTVTSYDSATQNSGTVLNQVQMEYNDFGQLIDEFQEHTGVVDEAFTPDVNYGYQLGTSSSNKIWLTDLTYPNGTGYTYQRTTYGGRFSRIDSIYDYVINNKVAAYTYLGTDTVVRITYEQPSIRLDLWGGTSGTFNGLDRFNRIIDQLWQNNITTTPAAIDEYQYGYDQNSNRTYKANVVGTAAVGYLDEGYSYDNLNRLTTMQRGNLSSGVITGTPSREMDYTLDPTGNWSAYLTKTSGTTDLNQTRTANKVNEITAIGGTPGWATPPAYDPAGNMTSFPQPATPTSNFTATYDAWNRMTSISAAGPTVATYQYDGRGRRIVKYTASISETRHFYYTNNWQDIEERVGSGTLDLQYVWGIRYVDELIFRDTGSGRLYATQDANFNLTSITDNSGTVVERYLFDPYGNRTVMNSSWGIISGSAYNWVIGHQGLMQDEENGLVYNRARYLSPMLGRFLGRDPFTYVDGLDLYALCRGNPICFLDPSGTKETTIVGGGTPALPVPPIRTLPGPTGSGPGTAVPGSGDNDTGGQQNCLGRALCNRTEKVDWPGLGKLTGKKQLDQALNTVPKGCTSVPCDGISASATRCGNGDQELEVYILSYQDGNNNLSLDFHAFGRTIGASAGPWTTKQGENELWNNVWDPDANFNKLYPPDQVHMLKKLCFCCKCANVQTK